MQEINLFNKEFSEGVERNGFVFVRIGGKLFPVNHYERSVVYDRRELFYHFEITFYWHNEKIGVLKLNDIKGV